MLTVRVSGDFAAAKRALSAYEPARLHKAAAAAINKTAEQGRAEARVLMARTFDRPTPYALGAVRVVNAKAGDLTGEVTLHGLPGGRGVSAHKFLGPEIAGGPRRDKASERRLKRAGVMPEGYQMVPGGGVQLDAYGNVPIKTVLQVLSWFQTYSAKGDRGRNLSAKTMERRRRGTRSQRGYEYFIVWDRRAGLHPGIWKRTFTGLGSAITPILMYVRPAKYRPIYEFPQTVDRVVKRDFGENLRQMLASGA